MELICYTNCMLKIFSGRRVLSLIFCALLLTGCAQSMKQRSNISDAINGRLTPINYNKTYIFSTFGYPGSKTVSDFSGIHKEIWLYVTNLGGKDLILNTRPVKTRYMKITMENDLVTDVTFE